MKFKTLFKAVELVANVIIIGETAKSIYNKFSPSDKKEDDDDEDDEDLNTETDEKDED